ncbi:MAG: hypothetical protein ACRCXZ_09580 [Patescibacteria group bacterium]
MKASASSKRFVCQSSGLASKTQSFTTQASRAQKGGTYVHVVIIEKGINVVWNAAHIVPTHLTSAQKAKVTASENAYIQGQINARINRFNASVSKCSLR